jgi:hypothetical protein
MLRDRDLRRPGILGVVANALLIVGDLGTSDSTQPLVADVLAVGHLLLLAWFALTAVRLLGWSRRASSGCSARGLSQGRRPRYVRLEMPRNVAWRLEQPTSGRFEESAAPRPKVPPSRGPATLYQTSSAESLELATEPGGPSDRRAKPGGRDGDDTRGSEG